jgi:hypothetical protein
LDKDLHYNDIKQTLETSNIPKKRRKNSPSPIALEPCYGNRAAVLSLLVKMPTGEKIFSISMKLLTKDFVIVQIFNLSIVR